MVFLATPDRFDNSSSETSCEVFHASEVKSRLSSWMSPMP